MKLKEIESSLDLTVRGDGELDVKGIKFADEAEEDDLAVAFNLRELKRTRARAVLTEPRIFRTKKTLVYCPFNQITQALAEVAKLFVHEGVYKDYSKPTPRRLFEGSVAVGDDVMVGEDVKFGAFVSIGSGVRIGGGTIIGDNVTIGDDTIIGADVVINSGARVGDNCFYYYVDVLYRRMFGGVGRTIIGDDVEIGYNTTIQRGTISDTIIGDRTFIGNLVEIAHDVKIGEDCLIVSQVGLCGNVRLGDGVRIFGQSGVNNFVRIGDRAMILARSAITKNVRERAKISGERGLDHFKELRLQAKLKKLIDRD